MILTNARIVTFDGESRVLDSGSVEILDDGTIGFVRSGRALSAKAVNLQGKLLIPALINAHTHLYSTLARGMHLPGRPPANFPEILKKLWWRLDRALNEEDVYYSALAGLMDSARCGVGTVIDHHSSPNACAGSLDAIEQAFREVGLRGATCYETSDRNGRRGSDAAIRENVRFIEHVRPGAQVGAMFGLHAAFTLGARTLRACLEAKPRGAGFHVHVSEDLCDRGAVHRLCELGVLDDKSVAAHCVHVTAAERKALAARKVNVVHNPQSNANNGVGTMDLRAHTRAGVRVGLGTDGYTPRVWEEFKSAARAGGAEAYAAAFANNRAMVKAIWGTEIGRIETGAKADLLLLDYRPPTPLASDNLPGHLVFGIANAPVDSLMVNGRWVLRSGHFVRIDEARIAERAAACAKALWDRF
jgi:putative selenium metabolism protein SsnA